MHRLCYDRCNDTGVGWSSLMSCAVPGGVLTLLSLQLIHGRNCSREPL